MGDVLPTGYSIGKYRLLRLLGHGGMGHVYEAVHEELGLRVALKILRQERVPEVEERFLREGRAAATLRHPHIVQVFDAGREHDTMFLAMELLEGEDLADRLAREKRLPVNAMVDVMLPVLAAVATMHDRGVVHRDLKPGNIFLAKDPYGTIQPKILDFGISRFGSTSDITRPGAFLGTPHYMSPEQVAGATADSRSDQFSLGIILYEVLSGCRPFDDASFLVILDQIRRETPKPMDPAAGVPTGLEGIVLRALEKEPSRRFASVFALGQAILAFAGERSRLLWMPVFSRPTTQEAPPLPLVDVVAPPTSLPDTFITPHERPPPDTQSSADTQTVSNAPTGPLCVIPTSDLDAVQRVREIIRASTRPVVLCAGRGTQPELAPPLSMVLAAIGKSITLVVLGEGSGPMSWRDPMADLCKELAPGNTSSAATSYLVFEKGEPVRVVKKDPFKPATDVRRLCDALAFPFPGVPDEE